MARPLPPAAALAEVAVSLAGTLIDVRHIGAGAEGSPWSPWLPRYTIGEGPAVHLPIALAGCEAQGSFTLVEAAGAAIRLRLHAAMTGTLRRGGAEVPVVSLVAAGELVHLLVPGESATLQVAGVEVSLRVEAATPVQRFRAELDRPLWLAQAGAMALLGVLMVIVHHGEPTTTAPGFDDPEVQANLIRYLTPRDEAATPVREPGPVAAASVVTARPVAPVTEVATPVAEVAEVAATGPSGQGLEDMARRSGIFSVGDFLAAIEAGHKDARASMARYAVFAGETAVWAAEAAKAPIDRGLELVGTGRQGGGLAREVVDIDVGLIAQLDEHGKRRWGGGKRAAKEAFVARDPAPAPEHRSSVVWTASVGRDLIRGVVNRHKPEVRQCFREGLTRDPELRGEVEVAFTIQGDGSVAYPTIARSTVNDRAVDACVTEAVKRWRFPVFVASGGDVDVKFPFAVGAA
jgi:TonB family protein